MTTRLVQGAILLAYHAMTCKEDGFSTASAACPRLVVFQPNEVHRETVTKRTRSWLKDVLCSTRFDNAPVLKRPDAPMSAKCSSDDSGSSSRFHLLQKLDRTRSVLG